MTRGIFSVMVLQVMLMEIKKLMNYCNYMNPDEIARRMIGLDNSEVDFKRFNNIFSINGKKRFVERGEKRFVNKKPSKNDSKTVAARLQKKLIERGKTPNLGANFFSFTNV